MGRGSSQTNGTAGAPPLGRKQARKQQQRAAAEKTLAEVFTGHIIESEAGHSIIRIADPHLHTANALNHTGEYRRRDLGFDTVTPPVCEYTSMYSYSPNMKEAGNSRIKTELKLDNRSGHIVAVNTVSLPLRGGILSGGGHARAYKAVDCGKDISKALEVAQDMYDQAWQQLRESELGQKARHVPYRFSDPVQYPESRTQPREFKEQAFYADEEVIREELAYAIKEKIRFDDYWVEKLKEETRFERQTREMGYEALIKH